MNLTSVCERDSALKTSSKLKKEPEKKRRRKGNTARANIIAAALELFAERGYARTTTRDIALRAESSEVLLFRYFQNKANLFREAVVDPFHSFMQRFLEAQLIAPGPVPFSGSQEFVSQLFDAVCEHRDILFTLVSTRLYETGAPEEHVDAETFKEYFRVAVRRIESELSTLGVKPSIPPEVSSRISFVSVVATALFRNWIFGDTGIDKDEVVVALNRFILSGMTVSPPFQAASGE